MGQVGRVCVLVITAVGIFTAAVAGTGRSVPATASEDDEVIAATTDMIMSAALHPGTRWSERTLVRQVAMGLDLLAYG